MLKAPALGFMADKNWIFTISWKKHGQIVVDLLRTSRVGFGGRGVTAPNQKGQNVYQTHPLYNKDYQHRRDVGEGGTKVPLAIYAASCPVVSTYLWAPKGLTYRISQGHQICSLYAAFVRRRGVKPMVWGGVL